MPQKKGPYFLDTYFLLTPADTQICQKKLQTNSSIEHYQAGLTAKNTRKPPALFTQRSFAVNMCIELQKSAVSEYIEHLAVFYAEDTLLPAKGAIFYVPH
ncbi:hypothetical protein B4907_05495 [Yersinia kristensenii]|nr:hypothetical protein B4907_05495 [Yersinia kristensenii]